MAKKFKPVRNVKLIGETDTGKWEDSLSIDIWEIFGGRPDILARHWQSGKRSGYSPICLKDGMKGCKRKRIPCSQCSNSEYAAINDVLMRRHLYDGDIIIGTYPINEKNECHYVAADFDNKKGKRDPLKDVKTYVDTLTQYGLPCYVLRSKSGLGYHVYTFTMDWTPAWKLRGIINAIIDDLEMPTFDRLFPTQDYLTGSGMGNLIALPFQKKARESNNTEILDPSTNYQEPYEEQPLEDIEYLEEADIRKLLKALFIEQPPLPGEREEGEWEADADSNTIAQHCGFLKHCIQDATSLPEPEWHSMISIVARCVNGEEEVHQYSKAYPTYDYDETSKKILSTLEGPGPHTCKFIQNNINDEYCQECEWTDTIKSPIQLGEPTPHVGEEQAESLMDTMNKRHAVVCLKNAVRILDENHGISYLRESDLRSIYKNRKIKVKKGKKTKEVNLADYWLEHEDRRYYSAETFHPGEVDDDIFNRFKGYNHKAKKGDWSLFRDHIRQIICSGNDDLYDYTMTWIADAVQNIADIRRKPGVAFVMRGGQGTGKSTFGDVVTSLFAPYSTTITDSHRLTQRFNDFIAESLVIFADEGFNVKGKRERSVLRGMLTSPEITMERKGLASELVPNFSRLIFASNEEHILSMAGDDRRFFVVDVSNAMAKNRQYFGTLYRQMYEESGIEAMRYDMERFKIKRDLRDIPETQAQKDQKMHSMDSIGLYWQSILESGVNNVELFDVEITGDKGVQAWANSMPTTLMHSHYLEWCTNSKVKHHDIVSSTPHFTVSVQRYMPPSTHIKQKKIRGRNLKCLIIPSYEECVDYWESSTSINVR